jgi:NAD(P)H dehydrogenase (quinone)
VIAVAGAAGKTGRAVIRALELHGQQVRPLVRGASGLAGEIVADLLDAESLASALRGVEAVYHMAPNMHPAEVEMGHTMISAARIAGVPKIGYHSVLHSQIQAMPHHVGKQRVEEAIIESQLRWTILQPAPYIQNLASASDGVLRIAYRATAPFSFVDLMDVAEAAANVLTSQTFEAGIFELAGPDILSVSDVASALGARVVSVGVDSWEAAALADGMARETARGLAAMFRHYDAHGLVGNPASLTLLLGRPPTPALTALRRTTRA